MVGGVGVVGVVVAGVVFVLIVVVIVVVAFPVFRFEGTSADTEAKDESDKRDGGENTKGHGFAFGRKTGGQTEQTAGDEGSDGAAGGGESLREAIQRAEDRVVRGGVCDLFGFAIR